MPTDNAVGHAVGLMVCPAAQAGTCDAKWCAHKHQHKHEATCDEAGHTEKCPARCVPAIAPESYCAATARRVWEAMRELCRAREGAVYGDNVVYECWHDSFGDVVICTLDTCPAMDEIRKELSQ